MKTILTATWAAVLFISSLPASAAQPEWNTRSVQVEYSDLDLTRPAGVSTLEHRVSGAVHQVCDGPAFGLQERMQQRACEGAAQSAASRDIEKAVTTAKQLQSTKSAGTAATTSAVDKAISGSKQQLWNRGNRVPGR